MKHKYPSLFPHDLDGHPINGLHAAVWWYLAMAGLVLLLGATR